MKGFSGQHNCSPYYRETIESLKSELEQRDDQITNIEIANQEMLAVDDARINKQVDENNELKAQVNALRDEIYKFAEMCDAEFGLDDGTETESHLPDAYHKAKQQCLASVEADFIKGTIADIEIGMANAHLDGDDVLEYLNIVLNKLKEQNKGE